MLAATVRLLPRSTQCIRHFHQSLQRPVLHPITSTLLQRRCLGEFTYYEFNCENSKILTGFAKCPKLLAN